MNKLFILGCPRSGTTMVQQALNRHSQIVIPPETKFFLSFFGYSRRQQARYVAQVNADLGIDLAPPAAAVRSPDDGRAFFDAMARQYAARVNRAGARYFGEKTPWHTGHLPRIRELFPDAKILLVYRDGRDVASSLSQMPWMTPDLYVNFLVWVYYSRIVREARDQAWPNVYLARYEHIVADPEAAFRDILRFLQLPYEPAVARGNGSRAAMTERELAWKARSLESITTDRVGVFRRKLGDEQIAILERLGGQALVSLGYSLLTDGRRRLPLRLFPRLAFGLARFAAGLPRHSAVRELLNFTARWRWLATAEAREFTGGRVPATGPVPARASECEPCVV